MTYRTPFFYSFDRGLTGSLLWGHVTWQFTKLLWPSGVVSIGHLRWPKRGHASYYWGVKRLLFVWMLESFNSSRFSIGFRLLGVGPCFVRWPQKKEWGDCLEYCFPLGRWEIGLSLDRPVCPRKYKART